MRQFITALLACLFLTCMACGADVLTGTAVSELKELPGDPPQGFDSSQAALAAVATGAVKAINFKPPTPDGVEVTRDVEFGTGGGRALKLDLYRPQNSDGPHAGLVFIHGGAWAGGSKDDYRYYGNVFASKGFVVASIEYRLTREAKYPAAVEDCKCAVRWLRANAADYNVDPDRIAAIGGSAGGHLAMMIGYSADVAKFEGEGGNEGVSSGVSCVVNLYGPTDLTTEFVRTNASAAGAVQNFLGPTINEELKLYQEASPITHLGEGDPPTLILHGTIDDIVPIDQADLLAARLQECKVPYVYDRLPGWPHAMDISQPVNDRCVFLMEQFFARYLADSE